MTTWPANDREFARAHLGCNVSTCPNGKCQATGECIDLPVVESPPLAPDFKYRYPFDDAGHTDEARRKEQAQDPRNG